MTEGAAEIAASGLFDTGFYVTSHLDIGAAGVDPLAHFCAYGWREGRKPNPWFETGWYFAANGDVRAAELNPLLHYIRHGETEGRRPAAHFDPAWYARAYQVPRLGALRHFLSERLHGSMLPCPELYAVPCLPPYREDKRNGIDPFLHYLADALAARIEPLPDVAVIAAAGVFEPNYYFVTGTDVRETALDPLLHFCRHGWHEDRRPCLYFDPGWYRRTNPEVERLEVNPLAHYVLAGEAAGRRPVVFFDPSWYRRTYSVPTDTLALAHFLANRRGQRVSPTPQFDVGWYLARARIGPNRDPFAHFLRTGTYNDIDPSTDFDAATYRQRFLGRPSRHFRHLLVPERDNPLVHWLHTDYRSLQDAEGELASAVPFSSA